MLSSMISATFKVGPALAMAVASVIIWAAGMGTKSAIVLLVATGIGGLIAASLVSIGLVYLAKRFGWNDNKLAAW
ncbi:hypothetical protein [Niallia circulans]|uniref:hypothetical protein n=1 Tax=Niallia circulans TaxID=1397 RepID=UPI00300B184A